MQALVIAAGLGSRMRPYTDNMPKQGIVVFGKSLFEHMTENFNMVNVSKVNYVTGHAKHFFESNNHIHCYFNDKYLENNILHSMMCARDVLEECLKKNEELIVSYGDIIFNNKILSLLSNSKDAITIIVDTKWKNLYYKRPDNSYFGSEMVSFTENGQLLKIGRFFNDSELSNLNTGEFIGLLKLSVKGIGIWLNVFDELNRKLHINEPFQKAKSWNQAYLSDFLAYLLEINEQIQIIKIKNGWMELDTVGDLQRCKEYSTLEEFENHFYPKVMV